MATKTSRSECIVYVFCTVFVIAGLALCMTGLLLPNWYKRQDEVGILKIRLHLGLWQDKVCSQGSCETFWLNDDDYTRSTRISFPHHKTVRILETLGCCLGGVALFCLVGIWTARPICKTAKKAAQIAFFVMALSSGFITVAGTLILASKLESGSLEWGPIISGIGGAMFFISSCLSCIICRYDSTYGTLENPVVPTFNNA